MSAVDDMTAHYRNEWRTARTQHRRARANYLWWLVGHAITVPADKVKD